MATTSRHLPLLLFLSSSFCFFTYTTTSASSATIVSSCPALSRPRVRRARNAIFGVTLGTSDRRSDYAKGHDRAIRIYDVKSNDLGL